MSYDLLRMGLIRRIPQANTYVPHGNGLRIALLYRRDSDPIERQTGSGVPSFDCPENIHPDGRKPVARSQFARYSRLTLTA